VIKPKILILHGADDPFVPKVQVEVFQDDMRAAKADWQFIYYEDAVHSFSDPNAGSNKSKGSAYNDLADRRSWKQMKIFLEEVFGD
jgi:dienelactone hydrolase